MKMSRPNTATTAATTDSRHDGASANEGRAPTSLQISSIITQTDASGQATRLAAPTYDIEDTESKDSARRRQQPGWFARLFCCMQISRPSLQRSAAQSVRNVSQANGTAVAESSSYVPPVETRNKPVKYPNTKHILPHNVGKKCLALDLDETLVHSSFQPVPQAHYVIPVTIDGMVHNVFVIKRPGVDEFMRRVAEHYEVLIYTASLAKYANPLLDRLDIHKVICNRLFRENCVFHDGHFVKDLSLLNRDLSQTIIVDNSAMSYIFHPENAIDCGTFIDDPNDIEMWQIADFLVAIKDVDDVRTACKHWREWCKQNPSSAPKR